MIESENSDEMQSLPSFFEPESLLQDDADTLRLAVLRITAALVGNCKQCLMISTDIADDAPIYCGQSDDLCYPRKVPVECCLACGKYK